MANMTTRPNASMGVGILLLSALALSSCDDASRAQGGPPPPPPVTVAPPLARQIVDWDEYAGHFEAVQAVEVRPRVSGYLLSVDFRDGDFVREGQVLFRIDPRPFQAELARARGDEAKARSDLALARREIDRAEALYKRKWLTRQDYDTKVAAVGSAAAALQAAQATVRSRALDVEFAQVRAPISGRVSDRKVDRGNLITGGEMGNATLLTTITSVDPIHFAFVGSESLYLKYQRLDRAGSRRSSRFAANPVEIRLQDDPGYSIRGRMDFVDNALDTGSGTIRGRAIIPNPDGFLTPGMFGRLRLLGSGAYTALLVPDSAVVTDQTRKLAMTVGRDRKVAPKVIELGPMVDGLRIVRSGLGPNDRVIIAGLQLARPGAPVTPRPGRIVPTAPGMAPQPDVAYSAPPAAAASDAPAGR